MSLVVGVEVAVVGVLGVSVVHLWAEFGVWRVCCVVGWWWWWCGAAIARATASVFAFIGVVMYSGVL